MTRARASLCLLLAACVLRAHFRASSCNQVITYYMGFVVELPHVWEPYKAARTALANTTTPASTRQLHVQCLEHVSSGRKMLQDHLTEGTLTDEFVLDNTQHLLHCVRECNIAIRWLMLHRRARTKKIGDGTERGREAEQLLLLLMNTAQLEYLLRQV